MTYAIIVIYAIICLFLIGIILIQQRTRGGLSSVLGGGGGAAETIFGSSGIAPVVTKATAVLGGLFVIFSFVMIFITSPRRYIPFEKKQKELQKQLQAPIPQVPAEPQPPEGGK